MSAIAKRHLVIPATDGFALAATIYGDGDDVVIINSATAVPRRYYKPFANFLAAEGYTVVSYDYRGIGESRPESLRGFECTASDWGLLDMQGVLDWVLAEFDPEVLFAIGHSAGGQQAGMLVGVDRITAMATMSSQSGYWGLQAEGEERKTRVQVSLVLPLLAQVFGYFPWSKIGSAQDLPKGAALQWARWCRDPNYLLGDDSLPLERYQDFGAPVLAYSVGDDAWGTEKSVRAMMSAYPNVEFEHIVPSERGLPSMGHFGYFRPKFRPLWEQTLAWLRESARNAGHSDETIVR